MIPVRIVGAVAVVAVLATSPASAQNDLRPDAKHFMQNDAWCPIVLKHHLPALTNAFVEFVKKDLSKRGDLAVYEAITPLLETLASVGRMDEKDPVRQAHLAMACTLGLPVVKNMIARDLR